MKDANNAEQGAVSHSGVVDSVERNVVHVKIVQNSACSECKIAAQCNTSESKVKMIDVTTARYEDYNVGDEVTVRVSSGVGFKAVAYAFLFPLLLMMVSIVVGYKLTGGNEAIAALLGVGAMVVSYTLLYICRSKFERIITFTIEHGSELSGKNDVTAT